MSDTVAVFHNLCGRRTVRHSCGCTHCRRPFAAIPADLRDLLDPAYAERQRERIAQGRRALDYRFGRPA
jgi:hypothetical protein